ncbi:dihydroorotase [Aerosakkonemataceae cyanobacterium BLCC-F154]|uniref:Dihydroorotase n=1 Tax=Floridaenema fluviatile BLCC-F154 TaxID=3153640 RepID=A0ABV4Y9K7_9CYAN
MNELLQQVRIVDPISGTERTADVLIIDGVIKAVENQIYEFPSDIQIRNCHDLILGPGLVDLYSHSGEPGFEERETLESLQKAAISGGFTRLAILPDTSPPIDNSAAVAKLQKNSPQLLPWGAITQGVQGQQMTEMAELTEAGVVGFADGKPIVNLALLRRVLEYLQPLGKPIALWSSYPELVGNGVMREGSDSIRLGLPGNPVMGETSALAAVLELVAAVGVPVHIMRVSTARSVQLIEDARSRNVPITASTTWMHLLLDTEAIASYNPSLRIEPPLGTPKDRLALRRGIKQGIIDAIAIDHTPYTYEEKTVAFSEAPPGAIGLELALPLLWENLVTTGEISPVELWRLLSTRPAECLQQIPPKINPGSPAEFTLFAPQETWQVNINNLASLAANTPWLGKEITGRIIQTWC